MPEFDPQGGCSPGPGHPLPRRHASQDRRHGRCLPDWPCVSREICPRPSERTCRSLTWRMVAREMPTRDRASRLPHGAYSMVESTAVTLAVSTTRPVRGTSFAVYLDGRERAA